MIVVKSVKQVQGQITAGTEKGAEVVADESLKHLSKQATCFSYVSVSLVLWSGNHLDGRKIGYCK